MDKKVVVLFPDEWVSFSPSILNLVEQLHNCDAQIKIICFGGSKYPIYAKDIKAEIDVIYIPRFVLALSVFFRFSSWLKSFLLFGRVKKNKYDEYVAVDLLPARVLAKNGIPFHFYSLEVEQHPFFLSAQFKDFSKSVVFQTKERCGYVLGEHDLDPIYIQNAPCYSKVTRYQKDCGGVVRLVCVGNLIPEHGVYHCIDALYGLSRVNLTLVGNIPLKVEQRIRSNYASLIENNRLFLHEDYIPQSEIISFLSRFHLGFCFYDFELISKNDFNYVSSPSGKVFNYFAAGVPVVGNNIVGLQSVLDFGAGLLLNELGREGIAKAIKRITNKFDTYLEGCHEAARLNDYSNQCRPLIKNILGDGVLLGGDSID